MAKCNAIHFSKEKYQPCLKVITAFYGRFAFDFPLAYHWVGLKPFGHPAIEFFDKVSTPLKNGSKKTAAAIMGLCSTTRSGNTPACKMGPVKGPLSRMMIMGVRVCNSVCGVVHARLRLLSLSIQEGKSTFGVVVGI